MLATISQRIRRAFGRRRGGEPAPEITRLMNHLAATCGGGVLGCPCGGVVTPIVNSYPDRTEVVALACLDCHSVASLEENGTLIGGNAAQVGAGVTVH